MASKRGLKKSIMRVCGDVAGECFFAKTDYPGIDCDKLDEIICNVALLQVSTIDKVSTKYENTQEVSDKKSARKARNKYFKSSRNKYFKSYYKSLNTNFIETIEKFIVEMNSLLTPEQKEANKQEA